MSFGLEKKTKSNSWWDYDYGDMEWSYAIANNGLAKKAIAERKTLYTTKCYEIHLEQLDRFTSFCEQNGLMLIMKSDDPKYVKYFFVGEEVSIEITKQQRNEYAMIDFITTDPEFLESFKEFHKKYGVHVEPPEFEPSPIFMICESQDEMYIEEQGEMHVPINRDLYAEKVLESFDKSVFDLKNDYPDGRITIFDGPPGSGKTFLIRGLITELGKEMFFVVVPPALVSKIGEPSFTTALMRKKRSSDKPLVLILEDADTLVSERLRENMDSISSALNMGDGILGDVFNIRLVITTNQPVVNIDPALMRAGRISSHVTVEALNKKEAERAVKSISGQDIELPNDRYTLAEVFQYCRDNNIEIISSQQKTRSVKKKKKKWSEHEHFLG